MKIKIGKGRMKSGGTWIWEEKWKLKEKIEKLFKEEYGGTCDFISSSVDILRYGFKCTKGRTGVEIRSSREDISGCRIFLLNATESELDKLREKDYWEISSYEEKRMLRQMKGDIELPITCSIEEVKRVMEYLNKK